jgi:hypothetical protein
MFTSGIDFASVSSAIFDGTLPLFLLPFSMGFWNCFDSVVLPIFLFIHPKKNTLLKQILYNIISRHR